MKKTALSNGKGRMKIKICGMRDPENIRAIACLEPDYLGFIFYEKSPRYAGALAPESLRELPAKIRKVGVFVNAPQEEILQRVEAYHLDRVQLHGDESPEVCARIGRKIPVIKAVSIWEVGDLAAATPYEGAVEALLFDTKTPMYGGSGRRFDWSILESYRGNTPFFLSGGIGPEDSHRIAQITLRGLHAIDLNSRFETEPGIKEAGLLQAFLRDFGRKAERPEEF